MVIRNRETGERREEGKIDGRGGDWGEKETKEEKGS